MIHTWTRNGGISQLNIFSLLLFCRVPFQSPPLLSLLVCILVSRSQPGQNMLSDDPLVVYARNSYLNNSHLVVNLIIVMYFPTTVTTAPGLHVRLEVLDAAVDGRHVTQHHGAHQELLFRPQYYLWVWLSGRSCEGKTRLSRSFPESRLYMKLTPSDWWP